MHIRTITRTPQMAAGQAAEILALIAQILTVIGQMIAAIADIDWPEKES